jgi:hypothetical protein
VLSILQNGGKPLNDPCVTVCRITLKQVTIARDLGKEVEIGSGLSPDDRVVQSPPDGIATGDLVRVAGAAGNPDASVIALAK